MKNVDDFCNLPAFCMFLFYDSVCGRMADLSGNLDLRKTLKKPILILGSDKQSSVNSIIFTLLIVLCSLLSVLHWRGQVFWEE